MNIVNERRLSLHVPEPAERPGDTDGRGAEAGSAPALQLRIDRLARHGKRVQSRAFARAERRSGDLDPAIDAFKHEAKVRADRFVEHWRKLQRTRAVHERDFDYLGIEQINEKLEHLAKSLHRDPKLESIVRNRVRQRGVSAFEGQALGHLQADWISGSRSRGLAI